MERRGRAMTSWSSKRSGRRFVRAAMSSGGRMPAPGARRRIGLSCAERAARVCAARRSRRRRCVGGGRLRAPARQHGSGDVRCRCAGGAPGNVVAERQRATAEEYRLILAILDDAAFDPTPWVGPDPTLDRAWVDSGAAPGCGAPGPRRSRRAGRGRGDCGAASPVRADGPHARGARADLAVGCPKLGPRSAKGVSPKSTRRRSLGWRRRFPPVTPTRSSVSTTRRARRRSC